MTPVEGLHESTVHTLLSSTDTGVWVIAPVAGLHASVVQALPSSTTMGV
jgi:hypothetical protein